LTPSPGDTTMSFAEELPSLHKAPVVTIKYCFMNVVK